MSKITSEDALGRVYDTRLLKRLWMYAKPYRCLLLFAFAFAAGIAGAEILLPYLTKVGIDDYIVISGKYIDLTNANEEFKEQVKSRYFNQSIRISKNELVIREGIMEPGDRKVFKDLNILKPGNYYIVDIQRYDSETRRRLDTFIQNNREIFQKTVHPYRFVAKSKSIEALSDEYKSLIRHPDWYGVVKIVIIYFSILIIAVVMMFGQVYLMTYIGQKIMYDIRIELFEHIERLPIQFFNLQPTGRLVTRVSNDVNVLNEVFTSILVEVFKNILLLIGIVIAMLLLSPRLAFVAFAVLPAIILVTWIFKRKIRDAFRIVRTKIALINATLSEHLSGMKIIKMFAREEFFLNKFKKINRECYDANMRQLITQSSFSPFIVFLENLGLALIIYYGGGEIIKNTVSLGTLVAFLSYLTMFFGPIRDIAEKFNIMQSAMASSERIFQLLDKSREDHYERLQPVVTKDDLIGKIEFKNVWFAYNKDEWILKDVSFQVEPGETVALVGATGSGKSTMLNLVMKFYEIQKGSILLDGINIRNFDRYNLRKHIAMVLQDVFLFSGDIQQNIRLNNDSISFEYLKKVANTVRADKFINRLKGQFNHKVEENGGTLSQGQRQLVSFARALAFQPKILILDEATANIDSETEKWIQEALEELMQERTAVVVAHRLSTIRSANKIIVMHRGRIHEIGNHEALMQKKGLYYKLYQLQFKKQESSFDTIPD